MGFAGYPASLGWIFHKVGSVKTLQDIHNALLKRWWRLTVPMRLRRRGIEIGTRGKFYGMPLVSMAGSSRITLGDRVVLASHSAFTALGVSRPCVLRTIRPGAVIAIGEDTRISGVVICAAVNITIGKRCLLGADVKIADTDFHALKPENRCFNNNPEDISAAPVSIGDDVFIGTGAIILKGVTIGTGSVIGAGSVVIKDVPEYSIAAGNPARVVRTIAPK
jgi:acetyltransferase-like isoleucine patch superfamily enzyme